MKLSAPIYRLKHRAKALSRKVAIPLHDALDRIAAQEGFRSWSLLAKTLSAERLAAKIFRRLRPGHMGIGRFSSRAGQDQTWVGAAGRGLKVRPTRHIFHAGVHGNRSP